MIQLALIGLLFVGLIGGAEMWKYKAIQSDRADRIVSEQKQQLIDLNNQLNAKQKVIDYADTLSKSRAEEAKRNQVRLEAIENSLRRLAETNPEVADWGSKLVPDAVRKLRRDEPSASNENIANLRDTKNPITTNSASTIQRYFQSGLTPRSQPMPHVVEPIKPR